MIITNVRVVWFANMNDLFNISTPYIQIASVGQVCNSVFRIRQKLKEWQSPSVCPSVTVISCLEHSIFDDFLA